MRPAADRTCPCRCSDGHFFATFQNTGAGAVRMPSTFLRSATGWYHWPRWTWVTISRVAHLHRLGDRLLLGRIGLARELVAQLLHLRVARPAEHAPCRSSALRKPVMTGLRMSAATHEVRNACQPPAFGGSFLARRATTRLPVHRLHVDLEAGLLHQRLGDRREVGQHVQVGRVHEHDRRAVVAGLLQQLLRLRRSWTRAGPSMPLSVASGVPQTNIALQTL